MTRLSDMFKSSNSIAIAIPGLISPFELLRAVLLYKYAVKKGIKVDFIVKSPVLSWVKDLLIEENINYINDITTGTPYVLEIEKGKEKIKSVKVDIKDGKLMVLLEPKQVRLTENDIKFISAKPEVDMVFVFGGSNFVNEVKNTIEENIKIVTLSEFNLNMGNITDVSITSLDKVIFDRNLIKEGTILYRLFLLSAYNDLLIYLINDRNEVDISLVKQAILKQVVSWKQKLNVSMLNNWTDKDYFVLGKIESSIEDLVPSYALWADLMFITATGLQKPVVTLIKLGDYVYTRILSPHRLDTKLTKHGLLVLPHIAEGVIRLKELTKFQDDISALFSGDVLKDDVVEEESINDTVSPSVVFNNSEEIEDKKEKIKDTVSNKLDDNAIIDITPEALSENESKKSTEKTEIMKDSKVKVSDNSTKGESVNVDDDIEESLDLAAIAKKISETLEG